MKNTTTNVASETVAQKYNPQEFIDKADKTFLSLIKDGKYKELIGGMASLGDYSLRNQMLILQQLPTATKVNNMNGWNFNRRSILPGSKSLKILAPVFDSVVQTEGGNVAAKQSQHVTGYKVNFVFDISQTKAKSSQLEQTDSESLETHYDTIIDALKKTLKSYEFKTDDMQADGILDTKQKTITLRNGMDKEQTLKTLVNQVGAALVLGRTRNYSSLKSDDLANIREVEISAVAAVVSKRLGLSHDNLQEPDLTPFTDEALMKFANNINTMRSVSQIMIMAAENAVTEVKAQQQLANALSQEDAHGQNDLLFDNSSDDVFGLEEPSQKPQSRASKNARVRNNVQAEMAG